MVCRARIKADSAPCRNTISCQVSYKARDCSEYSCISITIKPIPAPISVLFPSYLFLTSSCAVSITVVLRQCKWFQSVLSCSDSKKYTGRGAHCANRKSRQRRVYKCTYACCVYVRMMSEYRGYRLGNGP